MGLRIEAVRKGHKRKGFDGGKSSLDRYIAEQARQDVQRKLAVCFVLVDDADAVKGYYTLFNSSISKEAVPEELAGKLKLQGAYSHLPVTLLGRLAIDRSLAGQGYGRYLLVDALKKSYEATEQVASLAVVADPIDEQASQWYRKFGFIRLPDSGKLFLPMRTIGQLLETEDLA